MSEVIFVLHHQMKLQALESEDTADWQTFEINLDSDQTVTEVRLTIKGTGSGASGFHLIDARFMGTVAENPTDNYYVRVASFEKETRRINLARRHNRIDCLSI